MRMSEVADTFDSAFSKAVDLGNKLADKDKDADLWDIATFTTGQSGEPTQTPPTYMVAKLPGEKDPEFLLVLPFTPRNKQNLIGLMAARCDGEHLGEIVFLQLPKHSEFLF